MVDTTPMSRTLDPSGGVPVGAFDLLDPSGLWTPFRADSRQRVDCLPYQGFWPVSD